MVQWLAVHFPPSPMTSHFPLLKRAKAKVKAASHMIQRISHFEQSKDVILLVADLCLCDTIRRSGVSFIL